MQCSCSGVQSVLIEIHLYEIYLFFLVLILFYFIDVYTPIHIYMCVCLYADSHVWCMHIHMCVGTCVYGCKSIWRPDVFLNHSPLFKTYLFLIIVYGVWTHACNALGDPRHQNSLELELPTVVNHLTWALKTKLGSSARTNCALSCILYWGEVSQLYPEFA